jgi:GNAT superfamily N-acetyltransferase
LVLGHRCESGGLIVFRIRPACPEDASGIAKVHVDSWRTTYKGIVPDAHLDSLSYSARERQWLRVTTETSFGQDEMVFIVEDEGGQIVGFVSGGRERSGESDYDGELSAVYLLKSWQGRGIGRQLLVTLAQWLASSGFEAMLLWVLAENPAYHFYAAMGGQPLMTKTLEIGGVALEEVGFVWPKVSDVLTAAHGPSL